MQPFKSGQVVAIWLLRISIVVFLFLGNVRDLSPINLNSFRFYITFALVIFAVLLLVGGFMSKPGLTVISGLVIFFISAYRLVVLFNGRIDLDYTVHLFPLAIGFFFLCQGNK